jgi:hypothetical protein
MTRPQVAKRAVTYTDWTEGMRNPATHTNGIRDFQRALFGKKLFICAQSLLLFMLSQGKKGRDRRYRCGRLE